MSLKIIKFKNSDYESIENIINIKNFCDNYIFFKPILIDNNFKSNTETYDIELNILKFDSNIIKLLINYDIYNIELYNFKINDNIINALINYENINNLSIDELYELKNIYDYLCISENLLLNIKNNLKNNLNILLYNILFDINDLYLDFINNNEKYDYNNMYNILNAFKKLDINLSSNYQKIKEKYNNYNIIEKLNLEYLVFQYCLYLTINEFILSNNNINNINDNNIIRILSFYYAKHNKLKLPITINSHSETLTRFKKLTNNLNFSYNNMIIAGGLINLALDHSLNINDYQSSDIDIFLYGNIVDQNMQVKKIIELFPKEDIYIKKNTNNIITIWIKDFNRYIQMIYTYYTNIYDIINNYDTDHVKCWYDGINFNQTFDNVLSIKTKNVIYNDYPQNNIRLYKLHKRNYTINNIFNYKDKFIIDFNDLKLKHYLYINDNFNKLLPKKSCTDVENIININILSNTKFSDIVSLNNININKILFNDKIINNKYCITKINNIPINNNNLTKLYIGKFQLINITNNFYDDNYYKFYIFNIKGYYNIFNNISKNNDKYYISSRYDGFKVYIDNIKGDYLRIKYKKNNNYLLLNNYYKIYYYRTYLILLNADNYNLSLIL
jgi:hypothetical protein